MTDPNGLLYMRARYYDTFLCRFLNPDPSGFTGGLNFYAYANGNPVSYLDPYGLVAWGLLGRSTVGLVANGVVAVGGYLLAPETFGVAAVPATLAAYGVGANAGNIINALFERPAGPTGPIQTGLNIAAPNNENANRIGQAGDLIANLATGNELGSEEEIVSAAGLVTAARYDNATLSLANQFSTIYMNADYIGRYIEGAIVIVCGIATLIIAPGQIRRRIKSGKLDEKTAKWKSKLIWPVGCIIIGYGLLKIFVGF
ncbi:MAG TPA: RHS repeat-associated core domain-containing protein [Verrucomicrobiae bacterium]|nr:RHS repeat-associated core domain-containing protein [Verrucomicrobiae bacterium]